MCCLGGSVAGDADVLGGAVAVFVVDAFHGFAVHFQTALRCLEQVVEGTVTVLVETSAAGLLFILGILAVHDNCLLAAAVIRIVKTACYITIQLCHRIFLLQTKLPGKAAQMAGFTSVFFL